MHEYADGPEALSADSARPRFRWRNVLFGIAAVFAFSYVPVLYGSAPESEGGAYALGRAISPFLIATVVRLAYIGVLWRWRRVRFLSGWLFVIAAFCGFMTLQSPSS